MNGLIILRSNVDESAAGTLTEQAFNTPVDQNLLLAMKIFKVTLEVSLASVPAARPAADAAVALIIGTALSTRQGLTALPNFGTDGCLAMNRMVWCENSAPADAGVGMGGWSGNIVHQEHYPEGLIIADRTLSIYVQGNAGFAGAGGARCAIYYQLAKITPAEYMAALSAVANL